MNAPEGKGYVYVIEFSTGVIKVGMSKDGRGRVATHATGARLHGVDVVRSWISEPHHDYAGSESELIVWARSQKKASAHAGNEYFTGLDFDATVAHASEAAAVTKYGTGDWLTLEQVAERTSFTVGAIVRYIKRGAFPAERKGSYLMVRTVDLNAWMKAAPSAATPKGIASVSA